MIRSLLRNPSVCFSVRGSESDRFRGQLGFCRVRYQTQAKPVGMMIRKIFGSLPDCSKGFRALWTANEAVASKLSRNDGQFRLLGPPELYCSPSCSGPSVKDDDGDGPTTTTTVASKTSIPNPFMDSMVSRYNQGPNMGYTENMSLTYLSSGNPCLDFFFHVVPDTPPDQVTRRLKSAWEQDPITALKLVCNLRGVRGTGKSDREGFYSSALWLQENHPQTLAGNIGAIAEFGYYKDLLEILYRLLEGPTVRKTQKEMLQKRRADWGDKWWEKSGVIFSKEELWSRNEKRLAAAKKGIERYNNDPIYRFLHDRISEVFAEHLQSDLEKLKSKSYNNFSLAAKWCPSLYSPFDNYTLLCESIARRLFPRDKFPEYEGLEDAHYAYRVRDRLRKEVLVPLRKALKLPEVYMSAREWSSIAYTRVASIAMKNYSDLFEKHDGERFQQYLGRVKKGEAKIAAGALLPHEIVRTVKKRTDEVAELQWKRIVEDLSKIGKLNNCLAICDVSGSMSGEPLEVSVALGLLVSELSEEPWKGKLITFSSNPQLQVIKGEDLRSKIYSIERMDWEMNTDFQRVFDKILEVAVEGKLTEDQMIKRLFVFSDMEFDEASRPSAGYSSRYTLCNGVYKPAANDKWETDYQVIVRKFNENGFSKVPEIVFWNLRNSDATPVPSHQPGVALVSGFSKNLLKVFLEEGGVMDPVKTMEAAIAGKEYRQLVVLD